MNFPTRLLLPLLMFCGESAWSCRLQLDPMHGIEGPEDLAQFESIYLGRVVGVRMTTAIEDLKKNPQMEPVELLGGTMPFQYEVFPDQVMKGRVKRPQLAIAGGCGVRVPALLERLVVFRRSDGSSRFVSVSQTDSGYIQRLQECVAGKCGN